MQLPITTIMGNARPLRLGLCCKFRDQPIKFVTTTATAIGKMDRRDALAKLSRLCLENADALMAALQFLAANEIGCFRVNSQILPIKTHPTRGYQVDDLPDCDEIVCRFKECGRFVRNHEFRTCFHPDQFVVLNSPRPDVIEKSVEDLEYQAVVATWIGADVVNIHGGGAFGDKQKALADFARNLEFLSHRVRSRLTVENDDKTFRPVDLLAGVQSRRLAAGLRRSSSSLQPGWPERRADHHERRGTWNREPMFHISSPLEGWTAQAGASSRLHRRERSPGVLAAEKDNRGDRGKGERSGGAEVKRRAGAAW